MSDNLERSTMVRACHRCKEYVLIDPADPNNQNLIKIFESNHKRHTIVSLSLSEVIENYKNVEEKKPKVSQFDVRIVKTQRARDYLKRLEEKKKEQNQKKNDKK